MLSSFKMSLLEVEYLVEDNSSLDEMTNLSKEKTKLPFIVYVSTSDGVKHGPRIKVNKTTGRF
jgi:hypothetical protein